MGVLLDHLNIDNFEIGNKMFRPSYVHPHRIISNAIKLKPTKVSKEHKMNEYFFLLLISDFMISRSGLDS